jgi:hypothetical protein
MLIFATVNVGQRATWPGPVVLLQGEQAESFEWFKVSSVIGNVKKQGSVFISRFNLKQPHTY